MPRTGYWKCDKCLVRWYGEDGCCWVCDQPGRPSISVYIPEERRP